MDDQKMVAMMLSQLFFSIAFVFLFSKNYEAKGVSEGARFGLYAGLLIATLDIGAYCYLPIPLSLPIGEQKPVGC